MRSFLLASELTTLFDGTDHHFSVSHPRDISVFASSFVLVLLKGSYGSFQFSTVRSCCAVKSKKAGNGNESNHYLWIAFLDDGENSNCFEPSTFPGSSIRVPNFRAAANVLTSWAPCRTLSCPSLVAVADRIEFFGQLLPGLCLPCRCPPFVPHADITTRNVT
jgi:hypothetical protein